MVPVAQAVTLTHFSDRQRQSQRSSVKGPNKTQGIAVPAAVSENDTNQ